MRGAAGRSRENLPVPALCLCSRIIRCRKSGPSPAENRYNPQGLTQTPSTVSWKCRCDESANLHCRRFTHCSDDLTGCHSHSPLIPGASSGARFFKRHISVAVRYGNTDAHKGVFGYLRDNTVGAAVYRVTEIASLPPEVHPVVTHRKRVDGDILVMPFEYSTMDRRVENRCRIL